LLSLEGHVRWGITGTLGSCRLMVSRLASSYVGKRISPLYHVPLTIRTSLSHSTRSSSYSLSPAPNTFLRVSVLCASPPKILLHPPSPIFSIAASLPYALAFNATLQLLAVFVLQIRSLSFLSSLHPETDSVRDHVTKSVGGNAFGSTDGRLQTAMVLQGKDSSEIDEDLIRSGLERYIIPIHGQTRWSSLWSPASIQ
jgi:hypothetical protein